MKVFNGNMLFKIIKTVLMIKSEILRKSIKNSTTATNKSTIRRDFLST